MFSARIKAVIFFVLSITITTEANTETNNTNLDKIKDIYEKGGITEAEYNAAIKKFSLNEKKVDKEINKEKKVLSIANTKKNKKINNEEPITIKDLEKFGVYTELKVSDYPEEMYSVLSKGCKSNSCISDKATKKMSLIFKRSSKWAEKNPGQLIKAMGYYELFYWNNFRKKQKNIERYKNNINQKYIKKKMDENALRSLIGLNKGREKMRKALGMDLSLTIKDALKGYWVLGSFLDLGEGKNLKKLSPELKKRRRLLTEYKNNISKLKQKLEEDIK